MANVTLKRWNGSAWVEMLTTPATHTHTLAHIPSITATAAELNVLDGITATTAELNFTDGVTSNIQTQLDGKEPTITLTANRALLSDTNGKVNISSTTSTELSYLSGVSGAIQTQLNGKAPLASPALTGTPTAPTAAAGTNTTQIATTAFVSTAVANVINAAPGALDTLDELAAALGDDANFASTVTNSLALKAPLASPALTGTPTAPTAAGGTNTTQIATTAFVTSAVSTALTTSTSFGGDVSGTYNAIVVADDSHNHIISNVDGLQTALDGKAALAGATFTGDVFAPRFIANPSSGGNDTAGAWGIADYDDKLSAVRDYITDVYYPIYHTGNKPGVADINATGTPSSTTYLRGDGTWASVSGSGLTNTGTGSQSTGVGDTSTATATNSSAFGYSADATSTGSTAIGAFAQAYTGTYVTVVGMNANATGTESIAIGAASSATVAAQATASRAIAIGYGTDATGASSIAIGDSADATALDAIQLGTGTNATADTLQVFSYQLMDAAGNVPFSRHGVYDMLNIENETPLDATWEDTGIQLTLEANTTYYIDANFGVDKASANATTVYALSLVIDDATTGSPYVRAHFTGAELNSSVAPKLEYVNTLYTTDNGANATFTTGNNTNEYTGFINFQGMLYTGSTGAKTIKFRHRRSNSATTTKVALDSASAVAYKLV